uniref:Odorant receptor n=1 Tax=Leucinodes orbonalis TaxID=711050 RepID=A0AAU0QJZ0_9NEOP|nr:odorant receptor [Leucinodes orbonalis]
MAPGHTLPSHKTVVFFLNLNKIVYICGLPNIWGDALSISKPIQKFYNIFRHVSNLIFIIFIILEALSYFTQKNLTEKQKSVQAMFVLAHPLLFAYIASVDIWKNKIERLLHELVVELKRIHNDLHVEASMIRKAKKHCASFFSMFMITILMYGFEAIIDVIREGGTFTTVITSWPDVEDRSLLAGLARVFFYFLWWLFMVRVCAMYLEVISTIVVLSHQFKNLQKYFISLNLIFDQDLDQNGKELKYLESFKLGIKMHSKTLWCTKECQAAYNLLFGFQIMSVISILAMQMRQMVANVRTLENIVAVVSATAISLSSTGFLMCNAGDVTVEAADIPTAMYMSGWEKCHIHSISVRQLMIITMVQSQKPVIIRALGKIDFSYSSFVSLIKTSYTVFSVLF